jgi:hypothetical protein
MTIGGSPSLDSKNDTVTRSNRCKYPYGSRCRSHTRTSESKNHRNVMAGNNKRLNKDGEFLGLLNLLGGAKQESEVKKEV